MKRTLFYAAIAGAMFTASCNKDKDPVVDPNADFNTLKQTVLTDFTNKVAMPTYKELSDKADAFYVAMSNLNTNATEPNIAVVRQQWKDMRAVWESSEAFLFGPVDENSYDPNTDTWPTDVTQMDSLLASAQPLETSDITNFTLSLRGYHPIEYVIFGADGNRTAASLTSRQKKYMLSLAADLKTTVNALYQSWVTTGGNFADKVIKAGSGSDKYAKKQEVYIALVDGMAGICDEVGGGKMKEPYDAMDPTIVESPYSGNSITDFKNNITGIRNVYMGKYTEDGTGINELVALKNKSLDNKIQQAINEAISSFDNVTQPFGDAIHPTTGQRVQVQQVMDKLDALKTILENELKPFVVQYITD